MCEEAYRGNWSGRDSGEEVEEEPMGYVTAPRDRTMQAFAPATDRQLNFIESLLGARVYARRSRVRLRAALEAGTVTKQQASQTIEFLLQQPRQATAQREERSVANSAGTPDVPAGRYAIEHNGTLKFFKVDRPEAPSRWAGWTFLKVMASDEEHPIKNRQTRNEILELIAQDPQGATARYGHEIGRCGVCGRTLTDEDSRARGIGPVCAAARGW